MILVKSIQIPALPTEKPRRLYVYLPQDYRPTERYPVLYMFDGHNVFYDKDATYGKCWGMKEYLEQTRLPLIVVGIECNPEGHRRLNEYAPWDIETEDFGALEGLGQVTMDWLTGVLKPEIDRGYRTLPDREHTFLAGSSFGGLMTLYGLLAYNRFFSGGAALSPSLWAGAEHWDALIEAGQVAAPTRLYLDMGSAEVPPEDWSPCMKSLFGIAGALAVKGADVACRTVPGGEHSEAYWEKRIPVFLDYLLAKPGI